MSGAVGRLFADGARIAGVVMGWKRVAWTGCLVPVLGGCHGTDHGANDLVANKLLGHTEDAIQQRIRKDAREAWREVRAQHPRRAFTAEFHDGFLDGYIDYLDRGGDAQPPAVPPPKYTHHQKYFTPEGHALIRDYFLGFKYGVDVAIATGQRQYLTVPVLLPETGGPALSPTVIAPDPQPPSVLELPAPPTPTTTAPSSAPPMKLPTPRPVPAERSPGLGTKNTAPAPKPDAIPPVPDLSKFSSSAPEAEPVAPAPGSSGLPEIPAIPPISEPPPSAGSTPPKPSFTIKLPDPPPEVPLLPPGVAPPPILDEFPVQPPNLSLPPPLPVIHPDSVPAKK